MKILDDYKFKLKAVKAKFDESCLAFDTEKMKARYAELDELRSSPDLYSDPKRAAQINSEAKYISDQLARLDGYRSELDDLYTLIELVELEDEDGYEEEIQSTLNSLSDKIDQLHLQTLLKGEYDANNAILMLQAGAGGTEAQDWVSMLYRMYRMYAEKNGFTVEELDLIDGDVAGIKSVSFMVSGVNAY